MKDAVIEVNDSVLSFQPLLHHNMDTKGEDMPFASALNQQLLQSYQSSEHPHNKESKEVVEM